MSDRVAARARWEKDGAAAGCVPPAGRAFVRRAQVLENGRMGFGRAARALAWAVALFIGVPDASAALREVRTFSSVASVDRKGDADNDIRTFSLNGNYTLGTVHVIGTWTNPNGTASKPGHCYMRVTRPNGTAVDVRLAYITSGGGGTLVNADLKMGGIDPDGEWQLEFYESIDDAPGEADAVWTSLRLEFEDTNGGPNGSDITLCEVYGLEQRGRDGDIVGLSLGTTSWNVGTRAAVWRSVPDARHPVIAMNVYRLLDGRFEQIGHSWVKHGFYALSNTQCGGFCNITNGEFLGVGCTDTYTPATNAYQSGLGPRFEINPWTGAYDYTGSVLQTGLVGGDTQSSRMIRVRDDDFDADLNDGAQYFYEAFYIARDDVNTMNNAAWKPFLVAGQPGIGWIFDQTGQTSSPNPGFAIQGAYEGATLTTLAQFFPVNRGQAPDGRCLLATNVIDNGNGIWRYEFALMNVDMDRQVGSFEIEAPFGVVIKEVGCNAPEHFAEPLNRPAALGGVPIDNTPWSWHRTEHSVRWSTATNPLRWGTVYNFWFTANSPPIDGGVTLGLFTPGVVNEVSGVTRTPYPKARCQGDADGDGEIGFYDLVTVLDNWLGAGPVGDAMEDGEVNFFDLTTVLDNWQQACP